MPAGKDQAFVEAAAIAWEQVAPGVRRKITAYGDPIMSVLVEFTQGSVGALHAHPHVQITYVQSGSFDVTIDGMTKTLFAGDFFYVQSGLTHGVVALEDGALVDVFTPMREDFVGSK